MPTTLTNSDSFALSDSVALALGNPQSRAAEDNLFLSDSAAFLVALLSNPSDQLSLSDSVRILKSLQLALSDSFSFSDVLTSILEATQIQLTFSDSLSLSDSSSVSSSSSLDQYLRRYLNDVA